MLGIVALAMFLLAGCGFSFALLRRMCAAVRVYFGMTIGLVMMMWLPSLAAFFVGFTWTAQCAALAAAAILAIVAIAAAAVTRFLPAPPPAARGLQAPPLATHPSACLTLCLVAPMLIFSAYLQYTHVLREVDGALHVGQSTYGDLCLHLGIATGLQNAAYPPEYTLLPGTRLGYPFLSDAMAATMLVMGTPLTASFVITGTLMMGLCYWGFLILSYEMTRSGRAAAIAFALLFFNGGLGFLYTFDGVTQDNSRLMAALFDFYQTPTNMPDLNLRWVNVVADMMLPQRTLLAGWVMVIPALYLLSRAIRQGRCAQFAGLGVWAGAMPLVHTHSFLALGLISLGAMIYCAARAEKNRADVVRKFLLYGAIAVALALPQLIAFTFPQTLSGVEGGSMRFRFNWVNWDGQGLKDDYLWFWIKNVGLVYILMLPAALDARRHNRALAFGALLVYVAAELIQFQQNEYDNNKLFYVAFILMLPLVARYLVKIYDRMRLMRGRKLLLTAFMIASMLSGAVTLAREAISDYQLFSASEVEAAQYVAQNAVEDAVFATGSQHNNPVAALAGQKLVCGTGTYLYFHGVDYSDRQTAAQRIFENATRRAALIDQYQVDYIYISSYERGQYDIDIAQLKSIYPVWYENDEVCILAVSQRAQAKK